MSAETRIVSTPWKQVTDKQSHAPAEFAGWTGSHESSRQEQGRRVPKLQGMDDATASRGGDGEVRMDLDSDVE